MKRKWEQSEGYFGARHIIKRAWVAVPGGEATRRLDRRAGRDKADKARNTTDADTDRDTNAAGADDTASETRCEKKEGG